ncbi:hypothetical protein [Microvirga roseola]|uniref:hypothetical protein n=1 Tax=Microvirga roseola TaxID=2883126 RepID=UPI001E52A20E|nr:hypothetical protein [Microvirga roseola]
MRITPSLISRTAAMALAILAGAGLAACSGNANPTRDLFTAVGAGPKMAETPEFVAGSRPQSLEYLPVGTTQPDRPTPARTADEIKAAEAELDALRERNEARGAAAAELGGTPPPEPVKLPVKKSNSKKTQ